MVYLLLSILCSTAILLLFKFLDYLKISIFPVIVINYLIATALGSFLAFDSFKEIPIGSYSWYLPAILIGIMLIIMFFVMGYSTQKAGIRVTIIAGRMSMIVPIFFSIFYYSENLTPGKISGLLLALVAVILSIYRTDIKNSYFKFLYIPILLLLGMGFTDTLVKISQNDWVPVDQFELFTTIVFGISAIIGVMFSLLQFQTIKIKISFKTFLFGMALGIVNYGSLLFFMKALQYGHFDSSVVFGINNLGIVSLSVALAWLLFKEKVNVLNWIGVLFCLLSIIVLYMV